ncbi:hypothetical protein HZC07_05865, partial [Candidatus Micrarchaeota archaeon]|nr:hypothetical protein [Candidatus Micrarchaeota archaeon]
MANPRFLRVSGPIAPPFVADPKTFPREHLAEIQEHYIGRHDAPSDLLESVSALRFVAKQKGAYPLGPYDFGQDAIPPKKFQTDTFSGLGASSTDNLPKSVPRIGKPATPKIELTDAIERVMDACQPHADPRTESQFPRGTLKTAVSFILDGAVVWPTDRVRLA